jgi:hypothetical protein
MPITTVNLNCHLYVRECLINSVKPDFILRLRRKAKIDKSGMKITVDPCILVPEVSPGICDRTE